jgi:hypothetical protein
VTPLELHAPAHFVPPPQLTVSLPPIAPITAATPGINAPSTTPAFPENQLPADGAPILAQQPQTNPRKRGAASLSASGAASSKKRRTTATPAQSLQGIGPMAPPSAVHYSSIIQRNPGTRVPSTSCQFWRSIVALPTQDDESDRSTRTVLSGPVSKNQFPWLACRICPPHARGASGKRYIFSFIFMLSDGMLIFC